MRSLVTGAGGFIGGRLARAAADAGFEIVALARSRLPSGRQEKIAWLRGDLCDPGVALRAVADVDVVYHCAGTTLAAARTRDDLLSNVFVMRNVLAACEAKQVRRLVVVSSVAVYRPPLARRVDEDAAVGGADLYGQAKAQAEALVRARCDGSLPSWVILRPCQVFGEGDRSGFSGALASLVRRRWALVASGGERPFCLVHVDDLVDAILLAGAVDRAGGQIFNIAGPERVSLSGLRRAFHAGVPGSAVDLPVPAPIWRGVLATRWLGRALPSDCYRPILRTYRADTLHGSMLLGGPEYDMGRAHAVLGYRPTRRVLDGLVASSPDTAEGAER
jgi:nucleoside-diphosphate-sugar epimerase